MLSFLRINIARSPFTFSNRRRLPKVNGKHGCIVRTRRPLLNPGSRVASQESGLRSQGSGARSPESGARSPKLAGKSQEAKVRSQEAGARSPESESGGWSQESGVGVRSLGPRFGALLTPDALPRTPGSGFERGQFVRAFNPP